MFAYQGRVSVPVGDPFDTRYVVSPGGPTDAVVGVYNQFSRGSGTILGDGHYVLTAAHVVFGESADQMQIAVDLATGRIFLDVAEVIIHPDYSPDPISGFSSANDIAIIRLAEQSPIAGYDIYRGGSEIGSTFTLVGYGIAGTGAEGQLANGEDPGSRDVKRTGQNLYEVLDGDTDFNDVFGDITPDGSLLFYDFDDGTAAHDFFGQVLGINNTGLGLQEVSSTSGDSGGPNFINGQIAGVVSGGAAASGPDTTDIDGGIINSSFGELSFDTRVSFFQDWIDSIVGNIFNDGLNPGDPITGVVQPEEPEEPIFTNPFPLPLPGVAVTIEQSGPSTTPPSDLPDDEFVYRFFNTVTGTHFFTSSVVERDNLINTRADLNYEGEAFRAGEPFYPGSIEVFRFFNTVTGGHLYTSDPVEMSSIIQNLPAYTFEGAVFRGAGFPTGGMEEVYRFYNTLTGTHLYTTDEVERQHIIDTTPYLNFEGVAWYALPV
jgi:hypothetical protein